MKGKGSQVGWGFWFQWVLASTVGWVVSILVVFISSLYAIIIIGEEPTFIFMFTGIMVGIVVGVLQWLVLRRRISGVGWWVLASAAAGVGIQEIFEVNIGIDIYFWGGAVIGPLQWLVLRGQVSRAGWWVLASTVGWGLGMTAARAFIWSGSDNGIWALVVFAAVMGAVTGGALVWLLRQPVPEA